MMAVFLAQRQRIVRLKRKGSGMPATIGRSWPITWSTKSWDDPTKNPPGGFGCRVGTSLFLSSFREGQRKLSKRAWETFEGALRFSGSGTMCPVEGDYSFTFEEGDLLRWRMFHPTSPNLGQEELLVTKITISQTTNSQNQHKIGSFLVTELQRHRFMAALNIARQMHVPGDHDLDDVIRATLILNGGGHLDDEFRSMQAEDEEDYDRQVVAYYDGVAELTRSFDGQQPNAHLHATWGSC